MYCRNCGAKIDDDSLFCSECGTKVKDLEVNSIDSSIDNDNSNYTFSDTSNGENKSKWTTIKIAAFIFMLLGIFSTVTSIFTYQIFPNNQTFKFSIPLSLIWQIPMTIVYYKRVKNGEKNSTAFKVCSLIFVNLIAGILMLCDKDDKL